MDFETGFVAKPFAIVAPATSLVSRKRHHARMTSFQVAIWAGRIAQQLGVDAVETTALRHTARMYAFSVLTGTPVPGRRRVFGAWEPIITVARDFALALSPLHSEPALPKHVLRELLAVDDVDRLEAACALTECLGHDVQAMIASTTRFVSSGSRTRIESTPACNAG